VLDIPLHCLDEYEDRRVYERYYFINEAYKETKKRFLKDKEDYWKKQSKKKKKNRGGFG